MKIADYLTENDLVLAQRAKQLGVNYGVLRLPERPDFSLTDKSHWAAFIDRFLNLGIRPLVIEPLPNSLYDAVKCGSPDQGKALDQIKKIVALMGQFHIPVLCLNFMAHIGWYRTSADYPLRGNAKGTSFNLKDYSPKDDFSISHDKLWENMQLFFEEIIPVAEKYEVQLALHPDDPPVSRLGTVCRILTSMEAMDKAIHLVDSPCLGITLCQGCFAAMGENIPEAIHHFSKEGKLFYVHFRDVRGTRENFHETFHDDGQTDMAKVIRAYLDTGFNGPIRVDHVPTLYGEENENPGYAQLGRLYAIGYLKGLIDANMA